jgi:hypothetical protein
MQQTESKDQPMPMATIDMMCETAYANTQETARNYMSVFVFREMYEETRMRRDKVPEEPQKRRY